MKALLLKLERQARYLMAFVAAVLLLILLSVQAGWISKAPAYKEDAWYAVADHGNYVITSEYATEHGCRAGNMTTSLTCRPGKSLSAEARNGPAGKSETQNETQIR